MNSFWKKHPYISIGAVVALVVLGVFLCNLMLSSKKEKTTAVVERKALTRSVQADAEIVRAADYTLSFSQEGTVDAVFAWSGKKVAKGDLLVTLSNSKERAAYKKAQTALIKAQEKYRKVVGSSTQVLQEKVDEALAEVVFAQAAAENTRAALEKTRVRAPIDSTVVSVATSVGSTVTPDKVVVILRDTKNSYLTITLSNTDGQIVSEGQQVVSTIDGSIYKSLITGVFPHNEGYIATSLLPSDASYEAKTPAKVVITTAQVEDAFVIPSAALTQTEEGYVVEVVRDRMRTELVSVIPGIAGDGGFIQIKEGVTQGQRIVWKNADAVITD